MNMDFWTGVLVGVVGLVGVLALLGTWAGERQDGGLPPAKPGPGKAKKPKRATRRTGEK